MRFDQSVKQVLLVCVCFFALTGNAMADSLADAKRAYDAKDYEKAAKLYSTLAEHGDVVAELRLAEMYEDGTGVLQDYKKVAKLAQRAAEQGNAEGQLLLATLYQHGEGVQKNFLEAYMWSNIAAVHGNPLGSQSPAIIKRDTLAKFMTASQIAEAQELARKCTANKFKGCEKL